MAQPLVLLNFGAKFQRRFDFEAGNFQWLTVAGSRFLGWKYP